MSLRRRKTGTAVFACTGCGETVVLSADTTSFPHCTVCDSTEYTPVSTTGSRRSREAASAYDPAEKKPGARLDKAFDDPLPPGDAGQLKPPREG